VIEFIVQILTMDSCSAGKNTQKERLKDLKF